MNPYRVLLVGPHRGIIKLLRGRQIPFAVWWKKAAYRLTGAEKLASAPLFNTT
ncbi:MAG: hypothetical protein LJE83_09850 [Gammaproteobacteria bacterium]|nr:hypothetical protein [Gammaproteobacteria bacterium]